MDKRDGYQYFQLEFFCLTVPKNFVMEPFCAMFQSFLVARKFTDERGGEHQNFSSNLFSITLPKISVGGIS